MDALGTNPYRTAKTAGLGGDYVRDIIRGRVRDPSGKAIYALAEALETTPGYLLFGSSPVAASVVDDTREDGCFQPASRPAGPEDGAALTLADGRVTLNLNATVSVGVAAKILALIEGDR